MMSYARCTTDFDGCGQYLRVCHVGVAIVPDGNPKKLETMLFPLGPWPYGAGPLPEHLSDELPEPDRSIVSPLRRRLL